MNQNGVPSESSAEDAVQPPVTRDDLKKFWIGLGAAIEWIAMRGQPMSVKLYLAREDEAGEALVAKLADLPSEIAESLVRGAIEDKDSPLVAIPAGIWRQTATSDANDIGQPYRLVGTDDDNELEGAIYSVPVTGDRDAQAPGYRRVQIRTDFILDNWPEYTTDIEPSSPIRRVVAQAEVRRMIEKIVAMTPEDLAPLTQREIFELVGRCISDAPRDMVRQFYREIMPNSKPGPRGGRNPDRKLRIQELGEKLIAAQLPN